MPKRKDIKKVMIIGSGPIIIGQACEFDYSGTQACKALKEEGYQVVLVNSNPATIMTDPGTADRTYIEPLTLESVEKIIAKEKPDALLPNLGGQTGLNIASGLQASKVLKKYGVEIIGIQAEAIERGEDRLAFKEVMNSLGIPVPKSKPVRSVEEAEATAEKMGYPVVLRPAFTLGGTGGGISYNREELRNIVSRGLAASLVNQVLVEESVLGWQELELEIVRDKKNQKVTVCFIENVDAMGVHTGDSFCVVPMFTVDDKLRKEIEAMAYRIVDAIGVIGGTNVQLAYNPSEKRMAVIEINPRTSRSSALASKATGFPIARFSAKLATGITLDEIVYRKDKTLDQYRPQEDYVVVKFARWAFEKFPKAQDIIGTQMKAVGEVMSIGKNFKEAFQKSIRSLEIDRSGLGVKEFRNLSRASLQKKMASPSSQRIFLIYEALSRGFDIDELNQITYINKWFLRQIKEIAFFEKELSSYSWEKLPFEKLVKAKEDGFSDQYLADLFRIDERQVRDRRKEGGKVACFKKVEVSGAENSSYYYSTYASGQDQVSVSRQKKVMILGGGPNRIGQGIEFDYTCVHGAFALREEGYQSIMVNCNPETVSTDYDTSGKLYFEPLTVEDVLAIYEKEKPEGVIVQFGGQTPLNIAQQLEDNQVKILGTSPENIRLAEDREYFQKQIQSLGIPQPESGIAKSSREAVSIANRIGYPLIVRPSFVLGGRAMAVIYNESMLKDYSRQAIKVSPKYPMLIDRFLEEAIEVEVDALSDGRETFVSPVMEHIELAGVHSGDSACAIPSRSLTKENLEKIKKYTTQLARALKVVGLMNVQYAIHQGRVYILEANPRASRTVPLVAKVTGIPFASIATKLILGKKIKDFAQLKEKDISYTGVKEAVFPFNMFPEVDPVLGPEMKATGEVMGLAGSFGSAFYKAQEAAGLKLPVQGNVLLTVADKDKSDLLPVSRKLKELGFILYATQGTRLFLKKHNVLSRLVKKLHQGRPNIVDAIKNNDIHLIINTPVGRESKYDDSYIRIRAIQHGIPYVTSAAAAVASVEGIEAAKKGMIMPQALQDYYKK